MNTLKIIIVIMAIGAMAGVQAQTNQRYSAPKINAAHNNFLKRTNTNLINIDFIVANAIGEIKNAINEEQGSVDGVIDENTPNSTNSVIVLPGADADNVTIVNINEGDGTVISR